jgi:hypothetical protein
MLHQPPAELQAAMTISEVIRIGRNRHYQGDAMTRDYKRRKAIRWARRRAHRVPLSDGFKNNYGNI